MFSQKFPHGQKLYWVLSGLIGGLIGLFGGHIDLIDLIVGLIHGSFCLIGGLVGLIVV